MAQNISYKTYARTPRYVTVEEAFGKGMETTDNPLSEGFCRAMVNLDFKDSGMALRPRGGLRSLAEVACAGTTDLRIHHSGRTVESDSGISSADSLRSYVLLMSKSYVGGYVPVAGNDVAIILDDDDGTFTQATIEEATGAFYLQTTTETYSEDVHGVAFTAAMPNDLYFHLNSIAYIPCMHREVIDSVEVERKGFCSIHIRRPSTAVFTFIEPYAVTPREAINYGYNMLLDNPYLFQDSETTLSLIQLQGILPYTDDQCTRLLFNAVEGSEVYFRLYYQWAKADADATRSYKFKWEVQDLDTGESSLVSEDVADLDPVAAASHPAVGLLFNTSGHRSFAVKVTVYSSVDSYAAAQQVIILPTYNLTKPSSPETTVYPASYDLTTAKGMLVWNFRAILWGVDGARSTLFMSDINNPAWFPYPNNIQLFNENIITCIPFQSNLLVFTEKDIHLLSFAADGMSLYDKVIQQNLQLSMFDRRFVQAIRNMVFFKCGTAYHMIVPNIQSSIGELRLAPISRPVTNLLQDFKAEVFYLADTIYNLRGLYPGQSLDLVLQDGYNYLDGAIIRNCYRFRLKVAGTVVDHWFDFVLNYDADQRAWSVYLQPTYDARMQIYKTSAANYPTMVMPRFQTSTILQFLRRDDNEPMDQIVSTIFRNYQYLDTGFRDLDTQTKKRFRELQFKINTSGSGPMAFRHEFYVDDDQRDVLFEYETITEDGVTTVQRTFREDTVGYPHDEYGEDVTTFSSDYSQGPWTLPTTGSENLVTSTMKVRIPVSGKGYAPRLKLLSLNDSRVYEYLSQSWIYRMMNVR